LPHDTLIFMSPATPKRTILVADDDPQILQMVATHLAGQGYKVLQAKDGVEAVRCAQKEHPDLVVLDVMMPQMNGWEVARALRADPKSKDIGIVMLTAIGENINQLASPMYGADAVVDKPFDFAELRKKIESVFALRK
jgi:DNA-binding response OmpR family regulator